jgi:hypothetical protein
VSLPSALNFYEAHRIEIDAAIEADRQFAVAAGYGHQEQTASSSGC